MPANYTDRISEIRARTDSTWVHFLQVAAMSSSGAFKSPKDPKANYTILDFSEKERDDLLKRMEEIFGEDVKNSTSANGRSSVAMAPAFFYAGLVQGKIESMPE